MRSHIDFCNHKIINSSVSIGGAGCIVPESSKWLPLEECKGVRNRSGRVMWWNISLEKDTPYPSSIWMQMVLNMLPYTDCRMDLVFIGSFGVNSPTIWWIKVSFWMSWKPNHYIGTPIPAFKHHSVRWNTNHCIQTAITALEHQSQWRRQSTDQCSDLCSNAVICYPIHSGCFGCSIWMVRK